jgi:predicted anti-sigma-YlaC factor YlaD
LPRYVDLELSGQEAAQLLPHVAQHLGQCPECNEVYQALLKATRPEEDHR